MKLKELKEKVDIAYKAFGADVEFLIYVEDEGADIIEIEISPVMDNVETNAVMKMSFNSTEIAEEEW